MVLDPFTALSLASNIVQFIDFTGKVVSKCRGIHASDNGLLPENQELELIADDMARLSERLKAEKWPKRVKEDEKSLHALSDASIKISGELLERVAKHKVDIETSHRKWKSLRQAIETLWSKRELDEFAARLAQLRNELSIHVLVNLKANFDLIAIQQARRFDWLDSHTKFLIQNLAETRSELENRFQVQDLQQSSIFAGIRNDAEAQHTKTREMILEALKHYPPQGQISSKRSVTRSMVFDTLKEEGPWPIPKDSKENSDDMEKLWRNEPWEKQVLEKEKETKRRIEEDKEAQKVGQEIERIKQEQNFRQAILESLRFPTMDNRQLTILEAHAKTFDWVYESDLLETPWSSFKEWLARGNGIYWVNGKAGSGKSTLMRFIKEDHRTLRFLSEWAKGLEVNTAGFFFWNSGSPEQCSQSGLLRSILHDILRTKQKLIPAVFPARYESFHDDMPQGTDIKFFLQDVKRYRWSLLELMQAFQRLLKEDIGLVCLFLDGIDEYSGDPMEIVSLFKLAISAKLKICLSSRPWIVFEDAFSSYPQLKLQDLTSKDIQIYVNDTLCDDERMKRLYDSEPIEGPKLIQEIVEKADGVFLWVRLVVASLLKGLMNRDRIADLQRRLRLLPSQLEALFTYMLGQVESIYLVEGSRILQIMLMHQQITASVEKKYIQSEGLSAIELSYALDPNSSIALQSPIKLLDNSEVEERIADVDLRLKVRCAGLLEIPYYLQKESLVHTGRQYAQQIGEARVQWLHRTVKDFLETEDAQVMLRKNSKDDAGRIFSPSLSLLIANLFILKGWFLNLPVIDGVHPLPGCVVRAMTTASLVQDTEIRTATTILDELDNVVHRLSSPMQGHWVAEIFSDMADKDFLSLAHKYRLRYYILQRVCESPAGMTGIDESYFEYLDWTPPPATTLQTDETLGERLAKNKLLLDFLLQRRCNPNTNLNSQISAWHRALLELSRQSPLQENGAVWASIIKIFVGHDADRRTTLFVDGEGYDCRKIIDRAFSLRYPEDFQALSGLFPVMTVALKPPRHRFVSWIQRRISHRRTIK